MAVKNISVNDLNNKKIKDDQTIILIDCREQAEWDEARTSMALL